MKNDQPLLKPIILSAIIGLGIILTSPLATAETVQIPVGQQGGDKQSLQRPRAGMDQNQVREQFGNPVEWTNPVGEPPITKWVYNDFIVVFEYDQVIHTVLVHTPQPTSTTPDGSEPASGQNDALSVLSQTTN